MDRPSSSAHATQITKQLRPSWLLFLLLTPCPFCRSWSATAFKKQSIKHRQDQYGSEGPATIQQNALLPPVLVGIILWAGVGGALSGCRDTKVISTTSAGNLHHVEDPLEESGKNNPREFELPFAQSNFCGHRVRCKAAELCQSMPGPKRT